jgi:hypothetical protein
VSHNPRVNWLADVACELLSTYVLTWSKSVVMTSLLQDGLKVLNSVIMKVMRSKMQFNQFILKEYVRKSYNSTINSCMNYIYRSNSEFSQLISWFCKNELCKYKYKNLIQWHNYFFGHRLFIFATQTQLCTLINVNHVGYIKKN